MQYTVLIVEDEPDINGLLVKILSEADYRAVSAFSGVQAKLLVEKNMPDLILLDLMLPGMTGEEFLADLRENGHTQTPVIVISAKNSLSDKVSLLKNGADDYITKPFEPQEVEARVQAALRRSKKDGFAAGPLTYKELKLYPDARKAVLQVSGINENCKEKKKENKKEKKEKELPLTAHEFDILLLLMQHPDKVYSRESLYELVWNGGYYGENNTVNVHVSNIRKKIKEAGTDEEYIKTVYGIGFKLA